MDSDVLRICYAQGVTVWGFGIVQAQEVERAGRSLFHELCEVLSEVAGISFRPIITPGYRELAGSLERGEVGLAWLPPIPATDLESRGLTTVLAIPSRHGTTSYHAALVVRRGGPRTIGDLRGRRAVWVQRDSAAGYLVPRMHLAGQGLDVLHYFSRELFVHSHPAVIDAVVNGEADVGATYCHVDPKPGKTDKGSEPRLGESSSSEPSAEPTRRVVRAPWIDDDGSWVRPIDVLATFGPIPNDALVSSNELSAPERSAVTRSLLDPPPRLRDLFARLLGASDFRVPTSSHYEPLKHLIRTARARGHDALPPSSRAAILAARRAP